MSENGYYSRYDEKKERDFVIQLADYGIAWMQYDTEEVIKFGDRYSKLIYIYTLMHPKGYQRRSLNKQDQRFPELASLYRAVYMADPERLISCAAKDFNHMMSMAVSFIRKAIDKMIGCEELTIGNPRHFYGRTVIPAVYNGLEVIIDSQLQRHI